MKWQADASSAEPPPLAAGPLATPALSAALFDQSPFSSVIYDLDGRPLAVNAAFTKLMGLTLADVPPGYSVLTDEQLEAHGVLPMVRRAFAGERVTLPPVRYDGSTIAAGGNATWTQGELYPIHDDAGELTHVVLVHVDLTRHIETEAALRLSEQRLTGERLRLEGILNAVGDGITVQSPTGGIVYANDAAARVLGFASADEFLRASVPDVIASFEMFDEAGAPIRVDDLPGRRALNGEDSPESLICYRVRRTGEQHWSLVRARAIRNDDGEIVFVVNAFTDVTARMRQQRETEAARAAAEWAGQRARFLAEAGSVLASSLEYESTLRNVVRLAVPRIADWCTVHLLDQHGAVRRLEVAHADPELVATARAAERGHPPDPQTSAIARVVRTAEPELYAELGPETLSALAEDGEHLDVLRGLGLESAMVVPLTAHDRTLGALTLVAGRSGRRYDETDLEFACSLAARAALAIHTAELYRATEAANHAKAEFLAVMSHELRTPLNAIFGYGELLAEGVVGSLTERQLQHLARITQSAKHLSELIDTVLAFARIEAGRTEVELEDTDLAGLVTSAAALMQPAASSKGLTLETVIDDVVTVTTDPAKTRQILLNLLSNAVKFTSTGGITVRLRRYGDGARIDVADTGVGIRDVDMPRLWEPFTQLDPSLTRSQGGTGLGLAVSASLAALIGARLHVDSEPGVGSTFSLLLHANPRTAGEGAGAQAQVLP